LQKFAGRTPNPRKRARDEVHRGDIRAVDPKFQEPRFSQYLDAVDRLTEFARIRYGKSVVNWRCAGT